MTITLYDVSITTFIKGLRTLGHILEKAETHAKKKGLDPNVYVTTSLVADMKPLSFQVQVASNTVKKTVWRLTGVELDGWADDETTLEALKERVQRTIDLLQSVDAKSLEGRDEVLVELQMGKAGNVNLPCKLYVLNYGLPNFFFHLQTVYSILRSQGVPLGKTDYLNSFMN